MERTFIIQLIIFVMVIFQSIFIVILILRNRQNTQGNIMQKLIEYDGKLDRNESKLRDEFEKNREATSKSAQESRTELASSLKLFSEQLSSTITNFTGLVDNKIKNLQEFLDSGLKFNREELSKSLNEFEGKSSLRIDTLTKDTKENLEKNRETVEKKLSDIQKDNGEKLEQMRKTVDEKLQDSINKRFNESFELISKRLEEVQKGLGEMQTLANDVGGLKKALTNVKDKGTFGEIQLENLLEQMMSPEQYSMQQPVKENSQEKVDAVIKLPGQTDDGSMLLLPIDSKFYTEDYQKLCDAYEEGEPKEKLTELRKNFEKSVRATAKSIADKYINEPITTNFAIMFVPSESLYAEILRNTEMFESIRRELHVTILGPTNLAAFLNSLYLGFRTLAVQKQTSQVWKVLGAVKTEFGKFGGILDSASKQLETVANSITKAGTRTRAIERKLKEVEKLPEDKAQKLLEDLPMEENEETEELNI